MSRFILSSQLRTFYLLCALLIASIFEYVVSPQHYDFSKYVFYVNLCIFWIGTFAYFKACRKNNYFEFDTIFVCVYFIVGYISNFYFDDDIYPYLFLHFQFDDKYINSSIWLFTIGILSYYLGRLVISHDKYHNYNDVQRGGIVVNTNISVLFLVLLFIIYILLGGTSRYVDIYMHRESSGGIIVQIEILITTFAYVIISTELYNKRMLASYNIKKLPVLIVLTMICLLLYAGNRTLPSYFILSSLGLYTLLFKPISFKKMCILMMFGVVGMWAVGVSRSGDDITPTQDAALYVVDMTINTRNTYVAMEYVEDNGYTYGKTMLYGIIGVVPFLSSIIGLDKNEIGSAEVLTNYTYDNMSVTRAYIGLGTNIIADIYLSFGMIGVVVLMFIVGRFINMCTKAAGQFHYYSIITYAVVVSMSVFGIRTGLTHICRMLIWSLLIAYLNKYYTLYLLCRKK